MRASSVAHTPVVFGTTMTTAMTTMTTTTTNRDGVCIRERARASVRPSVRPWLVKRLGGTWRTSRAGEKEVMMHLPMIPRRDGPDGNGASRTSGDVNQRGRTIVASSRRPGIARSREAIAQRPKCFALARGREGERFAERMELRSATRHEHDHRPGGSSSFPPANAIARYGNTTITLLT